jgi:pantoate--beta-alanine ligase
VVFRPLESRFARRYIAGVTSPPVDRTLKALQSRLALWRGARHRIALVPTMGALHEGHLALVREAGQRATRVVVSIFVNPAQFAPTEDFSAYPRTEATDLEKLADVGVDGVFVPAVTEIYPPGFATAVSVAGPAEDLESVSRPQFFTGVATVVSKLLMAVQPDVALFGEKDYQQLLVVRRMAADLGFATEIAGVPVVREADGLAMSSRNVYLSESERAAAPALFAALTKAAEAIGNGQPTDKAIAEARTQMIAAGFKIDYVKLRNAETLKEIAGPGEPRRLLAAAWLGKTRLIDNVAV